MKMLLEGLRRMTNLATHTILVGETIQIWDGVLKNPPSTPTSTSSSVQGTHLEEIVSRLALGTNSLKHDYEKNLGILIELTKMLCEHSNKIEELMNEFRPKIEASISDLGNKINQLIT